jgi:hypothetical protein
MNNFMILPTLSNRSDVINQSDNTDSLMPKTNLEPTLSFQSNDAYTIVNVPLK